MDTESNLAVRNLLLLLDDIERKCFKASVEYEYSDKFHFPSEVDSFHTKMNSKFAIIKSLKNAINTLFLTEPTDTPMEIINGVKEVLLEISDAIHQNCVFALEINVLRVFVHHEYFPSINIHKTKPRATDKRSIRVVVEKRSRKTVFLYMDKGENEDRKNGIFIYG